jgi:hypothetical protein
MSGNFLASGIQHRFPASKHATIHAAGYGKAAPVSGSPCLQHLVTVLKHNQWTGNEINRAGHTCLQ